MQFHFILRLNIFLFSSTFLVAGTLAQVSVPNSAENIVDLENVKAPPRNIKDILLVLDTTKQDLTAQDQAKKILASPKPDSNDPKILNNFYYKQAKS